MINFDIAQAHLQNTQKILHRIEMEEHFTKATLPVITPHYLLRSKSFKKAAINFYQSIGTDIAPHMAKCNSTRDCYVVISHHIATSLVTFMNFQKDESSSFLFMLSLRVRRDSEKDYQAIIKRFPHNEKFSFCVLFQDDSFHYIAKNIMFNYSESPFRGRFLRRTKRLFRKVCLHPSSVRWIGNIFFQHFMSLFFFIIAKEFKIFRKTYNVKDFELAHTLILMLMAEQALESEWIVRTVNKELKKKI